MALATVIGQQATNESAKYRPRTSFAPSVKEMAAAILLVLGAPAELPARERLGHTEAVLHQNSENCCFKQRGYNWSFEDGV